MAEDSATTAGKNSESVEKQEVKVVEDSADKQEENKPAEPKVVGENGNENVVEPKSEEESEEPTPAKKREVSSDKEDNTEENAEKEDESENLCNEKTGKEAEDLDDDQKVENPAYIPKIGKFYMHDDDRRDYNVKGENDIEKESEDDEEMKNDEKSKSRADCVWKHDRFDEKFQRPKTKKQIVTKYGFDIRTDQKDDDTSVAPESTEEDSDIRKVRQDERRSTGSSRANRGRGPIKNRRRPMRQREREDTVDESEERKERNEDGQPPAEKKQVHVKKQAKKITTPPLQPQTQQRQQQQQRNSNRSSEEGDDDDEDANLRPGQRRLPSSAIRRGISSSSRLRGRISSTGNRRAGNGINHRLDHHHHREPLSSNRQVQSGPLASRVRGTGRGSHRGSSYSDRPSRGGNNSRFDRGSKREYNNQRGDDRHENDDRFENHRRGVIRGSGAVSRGFSRGFSRGTIARGSTRGRGISSGRYHSRREDTSEQSDTGHNTQRLTNSYPSRGSSTSVPIPRGGVSNFSRGGVSGSNSNQVGYPPSRGGRFNNSNGGDYARGGYHQLTKTYPVHHSAVVPIASVGATLPPNVPPPPQMTRGTTHGGNAQQSTSQQQQRIRQPTDVVYFDTIQQPVNRQPPPSRAKKVIPIIDPNTAK